MKIKLTKRPLVFFTIAIGLLIAVPTTYASNHGFFDSARRYYDSNCKSHNKASTAAAVNCFLYEKVTSLDDSITNLKHRLGGVEHINSEQNSEINDLEARVAGLEDALEPTPTVTPTPEPTAIPTATPTLTPVPTPTGTPSPEPTATEEPTPTEVPEETPTPTASPEPTATPEETPTPTLTPVPTTTPVSLGSVVINEIMWMGSLTGTTSSTADEWIELRNMTSSSIDLTGWSVDGAGSGTAAIILSGTIPANGYFLLSNYDSSSSAISNALVVDQVTTAVSIDNAGEQLTLKNSQSAVVDQTPTGMWSAGLNDTTKNSMERNTTSGDGILGSNWHSCTDAACNDTVYWDVEGFNYGTPKSLNI